MTSSLAPTEAPLTAHAHELDRLLSSDGIVTMYQPIVDLRTQQPIGYEALARGPITSPLHLPSELFGTATALGRLTELDWTCRAAAMRGAIGTALGRPSTLFVNVEPVAAATRVPTEFEALVAEAQQELRLVYEYTERALADRPAEVLRSVRELRRQGAAIALDDVGVDPRSLALMPFLKPEVVKLDLRLIQGPPSAAMARTMHAVGAYAEQSGAMIVAEGIETEEHYQRALALGAGYGQGWLFGIPALPPTAREGQAALPIVLRSVDSDPPGTTPYQSVLAAGHHPRTASKRLVLALSRQLETFAEELGPECVVLADLQHVGNLTAKTAARYQDLATRTAFAGVVGVGMPAHPTHAARGGALAANDPLTHEWSVFVVSPHFAAAMVASDLGDLCPDMERRFAFCLTYDRATVVRAARLLMARIAPTTDD